MTGVAGRLEVAIGGMAITGFGTGFAEVAGFAGVAELVSAKKRGYYFSIVFLFALPFGACTSLGMESLLLATDGSFVVCQWRCLRVEFMDSSYFEWIKCDIHWIALLSCS